jgi:hypothetical protein
MTTRCLIGVAVPGVKVQLLAALVLGTATALTVFGDAFAPATVVPTATPTPITAAAPMAA